MSDDDIENVYLAGNLLEADFLRNVLESAGIEARVVGAGSAMVGMFPHEEAAPCLWVRRRDASAARQLLTEWEERRARPPRDENQSAEGWKCTACGETVDAEFEMCWNCQNLRTPE
jgi:Putative prokaryotic signal transducing protein